MEPSPLSIVSALPSTIPFVAPEELERSIGRPFRLRLGANESLFGASPLAIAAMQEQVLNAHYYCDPQGKDLRQALAKLHGLELDNIVLGAGIDGLLMLFARAYLDSNSVAVTSLGTYPTFEYAATAVGAKIIRVPYQNGALDLDALSKAAWTCKAQILYVANPDNPSGSFHGKAAMDKFKASLPPTTLLVLDEAYADFVPLEELTDSSNLSNVVRARTFSKAHGMAGLRIGYAMGSSNLVHTLDKIRPHFEVNSVAQAGALGSLQDSSHLQYVMEQTEIGRQTLVGIVEKLGWKPMPSHTNFITIDMDSVETANRLMQQLLTLGVFIRKPRRPPLDQCIRISVGREQDLTLLAELLPEAWQACGAADALR